MLICKVANIKVVMSYLKADLVKKQMNFKIGMITVFLVVLFLSLIMNIIYLSSFIFLRLSENEVGETDIIMTPILKTKDTKYRKGILEALIDLDYTKHDKNKENKDLENNINNYLKKNGIDSISFKVINEESNINSIDKNKMFKSTSNNIMIKSDNIYDKNSSNTNIKNLPDKSNNIINEKRIYPNNCIINNISNINNKSNYQEISSIKIIKNLHNEIFKESNQYDLSEFNLLNYTLIKNNFKHKTKDIYDNDMLDNFEKHGVEEIIKAAPRWVFRANANNELNSIRSNLLIIDSKLENEIKLGRKADLPTLGYFECLISKSLFEQLQLNNTLIKDEKSEVEIDINLSVLLNTLGKSTNENYDKVYFYNTEVKEDFSKYDSEIPTSRYATRKKSKIVYSEDPTVKIPTYLNKTKIDSISNDGNSEEDDRKSKDIEHQDLSNSAKLIRNIISNNEYFNKEYKVSFKSKNIIDIISKNKISNEIKSNINQLFASNLASNKEATDNEIDSLLSSLIISQMYLDFNDISKSITDIEDSVYDSSNYYVNNKNEVIFKSLIKFTSFEINTFQVVDTEESFESFKSQANEIKDYIGFIFKNNSDITTNNNYISKLLKKENYKKEVLSFTIKPAKSLNSLTDAQLVSIFSFKLKLRIKEVLNSDNSKGIYPKSLDNVIIIDSTYMKDYLIQNIIRVIDEYSEIKEAQKTPTQNSIMKIIKEDIRRNLFNNFNINDYALTINFLLNNKFKLYKQTKIGQLRDLIQISNQIIGNIDDTYPGKVIFPIYLTYKLYSIAENFLSNIFSSIVFFLIILSTILIYSLINGNVEVKSYEFGMLRAIGFKKNNLSLLIILQTFLFSIPAIILGLIVAWIINIFISYILFDFSAIDAGYFMDGFTIFTVRMTIYISIYF